MDHEVLGLRTPAGELPDGLRTFFFLAFSLKKLSASKLNRCKVTATMLEVFAVALGILCEHIAEICAHTAHKHSQNAVIKMEKASCSCEHPLQVHVMRESKYARLALKKKKVILC